MAPMAGKDEIGYAQPPVRADAAKQRRHQLRRRVVTARQYGCRVQPRLAGKGKRRAAWSTHRWSSKDEQTDTYWSIMEGEAIAGELNGENSRSFP